MFLINCGRTKLVSNSVCEVQVLKRKESRIGSKRVLLMSLAAYRPKVRSVNRERERQRHSERQRQSGRERDRQADRQTGRQTESERETEREREREREIG